MLYPDVWGYLLGQDIPAAVIPVYPGSARLVCPARFECRIIYGIVDPYELTQGVVLVRSRVSVTGLARYVAPAVIRVRQVERVRSAALRYRRYQGSGGVAAVRGITLYITVLGIVFDAVRQFPAGLQQYIFKGQVIPVFSVSSVIDDIDFAQRKVCP